MEPGIITRLLDMNPFRPFVLAVAGESIKVRSPDRMTFVSGTQTAVIESDEGVAIIDLRRIQSVRMQVDTGFADMGRLYTLGK